MEKNAGTILLVEDESIIAMMERKELESRGYCVHQAGTGEEAVKTVVEGGLPLDLVLMDINLGDGIDGTEAAKQILAHVEIPVVFLSSHTEPEVVEKTEKITSYGYVVKNSGIVVLDASIKMALKLFEARIERGRAFQSLDAANEKLQTTVEVLESTNAELIRTQVELQIKSLHLEAFIENAPLAVQLFDKEGHSIYVNKIFNEMWPAPPPMEWCFFEDQQLLAAGFAPEFERLRRGETITLPEIKFRPSRSLPGAPDVERYISILMFPLREVDGTIERFALIGHDITERRRMEETLRESEEKYRVLVEAAMESIFIAQDGRIRFCNQAFSDFSGYTLKELAGRPFTDLIHPDDRQMVFDRYVQRLEGKEVTPRYTFRFINLSGHTRWADMAVSIISWEGKPASLCVAADITERKAAEEALREGERRAASQRSAIAELVLDQVLAGGEMSGALKRLAEVLSATLDVARASVWILAADGSELRCLSLYEAGNKTHSGGSILQAADFPRYFEAILAENRIYARDAQNDPRTIELTEPYLKELGITSMLDAGFFIEGRLAGVVCCEHTGAMRKWHPDEESFVSTAAAIVGQLILSSELVTQRERLQSISDNVPGVVYRFYALMTGEFGMTYLSGRTVELFELQSDIDTFSPEFLGHIHPDDRDAFMASIRDAVATVSPWRFEGRFVKPSGGILWFSGASHPTRLADRIVFDGLLLDITGRKRAEQLMQIRLSLTEFAATHSLEELLRKTLDEVGDLCDSPIGFYHFVDKDQKALSLQAWSTRTLKEFCRAEGRGLHYKIDQAGVWVDCVREKRPVVHNDYNSLPHRKGLPEGHAPVARELVVPVMRDENIVAILGVGNKPSNYTDEDVALVSFLADVTWEITRRKMAEEELAQKNSELEALNEELSATNEEFEAMNEELIETNQLLAIKEKEYRLLFESASSGIFIARGDRILMVNPAGERIIGRTAEELKSRPFPDFLHPEDLEGVADRYIRKMSGEEVVNTPVRVITGDGETRWLEVNTTPVTMAGGPASLNHVIDVTGRTLAEFAVKEAFEELRVREEQYEFITANVMDLIAYAGSDGCYRYVSPSCHEILGYEQVDLVNVAGFKILHPDDHARVSGLYADAISRKELSLRYEARLRHKDGRHVPFEVSVKILYDERSAYSGFLLTGRDITERKRAEAEKEKLQGQLAQSQKMESVGRLAGGVAHDFNNMLGVILGHTELALGGIGADDPLRNDLEEIQKAAGRSADLTRQLLAFARRQTVAPKVLNLNDTIEGMLKMIRRLIGEEINLNWKPGHEPWTVWVDPSQIDQVLVNLCVNARDAIAGVGTIIIETDNAVLDGKYCAGIEGLVPGEYVLLAVSDDGRGMDAEIISHIYEPFFTTCENGEGTGLGLSMVYGAVKQNNGFINVYSEPGRGSTFKVYLPRHEDGDAHGTEEGAPTEAARGSETILLVEDEAMILNVTTTMLKTLGYKVLAAPSPGEAIRIAREHPGPIDLLITDVVMPVMNGRDLAESLLSIHPGIRWIFMSGYTSNVIAHQGVLDEGVSFLQKPFSRNDLAAKIQEVLE